MNPAALNDALTLAARHQQTGRIAEASDIYKQVLAANPDHPLAMTLLGMIAADLGNLPEAARLLARAVEIQPEFADAQTYLGIVLGKLNRLNAAAEALAKVVELQPRSAPARSNLGNVLRQMDRAAEAAAAYRQALDLDPSLPEARMNLGSLLFAGGQVVEAIDHYRQVVAARPENAQAHSRLVYYSMFHPHFDARMILKSARGFARAFERPLASTIRPHTNDRTPDRRLKIGYISPNLRGHVIGWNLWPLLAHHYHADFEIHCYNDGPRGDTTTDALRQMSDRWRDIPGSSDELVADLVRQDGIDILVDLTLHLAQNRLLVFARKPAPVQVTFIGYPGTTGLSSIDYRLSDPHLDPPGETEAFYTEQTVRLPGSFWCYDPDAMQLPTAPLGPPPAETNGHITFGCLNSLSKVNDEVLRLWAGILAQVENSRLILLASPGARQRVIDEMASHGIASDRLQFVPRQNRADYLRAYLRMDLFLDTFPYGGHTTCLDALWMGVPPITLRGQTVSGRGGASILVNLQLNHWIAQTPGEYMQLAIARARDLPGLALLRSELRRKMRESVLMNGPNFAAHVEAAYRTMWLKWVGG